MSCDRSAVRQARQPIGRGLQLGDREVAQVRQHRRRLGDRFADPLTRARIELVVMADQHHADDLAAHEQRLTGRAPGSAPQI